MIGLALMMMRTTGSRRIPQRACDCDFCLRYFELVDACPYQMNTEVITWHVIYREHGGVADYEFTAPPDFGAAGRIFRAQHPEADYWALGLPVVEMPYAGMRMS